MANASVAEEFLKNAMPDIISQLEVTPNYDSLSLTVTFSVNIATLTNQEIQLIIEKIFALNTELKS